MEQFEMAVKFNPKCSYAWHNMGCIFKEMKEYGGAMQHFRKVLEIDSAF